MSDILRKQNRMMNCPAVTAGQIPYRNVTVEDKLDELDNRASANTFGTAVDLTAYNTSSNKYTFPSDGYISLYCDTNGSSTYAGIMVYLYDANGNTFIRTYVKSRMEAGGNANFSLFVKKGMSVYVTTSGTAAKDASFYPLEGSALPSAESEGF